MKELGILDLLGLCGFTPSKGDRIARHKHSRYPVDQLLSLGLFEAYQCYQNKPEFHKAGHLIATSGLRGNRACFQGVFAVDGCHPPAAKPAYTTSAWEAEWRSCKFMYDLRRLKGFESLEGRVIVDWGKGALAWNQRVSNKPVIEITAPGRFLAPFRDYLEFSLSFSELQALFRNEDAHHEWRSRLSAVAGVYLILAEESGEQYVGSATGAEGIWGRWRDYARTGHGGNKLLRTLVDLDKRYPQGLRFSLLQILPKSMSREDVIERETSYKAKLGSRAHGLNS